MLKCQPQAYQQDLLLTWPWQTCQNAQEAQDCEVDHPSMNPLASRQSGKASKPAGAPLTSLRRYFVFIRFAAASLLTAAIDNLVFLLAYSLSGGIAQSQIASRLVACVFNYITNKRGVFHSREHNVTALPKYILNVVVAGILAYVLIGKLVTYLHWSVIVAKIVAETAIFFLNFTVQRAFVFSTRRSEPLE
jgi:putative flippase GtrA